MNRREALFAAGAAAVGTRPARAADSAQNIVIQAPFHVVVLEIAKAGSVASGQQLFRLGCFETEHWESQIELHEQHLEILERPFKDGRVDANITLIKGEYRLVSDEWEKSEHAFAEFLEGRKLGRGSSSDEDSARVTRDELYRKLISLKLEAEHADQKKQDSIDKLALGRQKLRRQRQLLEDAKKLLIIASPVAGKFVPRIGVGLSSKKGHVLGEIA